MRYGGIVILAIVAGVLGVLKLFETELTYPLDPTPIRPADLSLNMIEQQLVTGDGTELVVWHAPPDPGAPILLYFPGNAGNLGNRAQRFALLSGAGIGISALAYRGSNGSGGSPSEAAIIEDAKLLTQLTAATYPDREIIYYGESLGTGVAARLATVIAPDRMVLEAPYTSIPDAALKGPAPDWLDILFTNLWNTDQHIKSVTVPLLILHGLEDAVIPVELGRVVYTNAGSPDKELLELPGVGHHNVWQPEVQSRLITFLKG